MPIFNDDETESMIRMLEKYNNAKTAEEGFGALNGLITAGEVGLERQKQITLEVE